LTERGIDTENLDFIPRERFDLLSNGKIRCGDILFCLRGSLGKFASVGSISEGAIASSLVIVRPQECVLDSFLLAYFESDLCSQMINNFKNGAAQPNLSANSLRQFAIPVPPLPEQRRIVGILDEAFDAVATAKVNTENNLQNARALFESHLQSVFTQGCEGWVETTLGRVCRFENGDRGKNYPNREEYVESGIPWINTGHIQADGTLSQSEMNFISREKYESLRSGKIQAGDLVYCLRGATLGKTALVDPFTEGAVASSLVIIRPGSLLDRRFLYYFLISPPGQRTIELYQNGAAQPNLGAKSVAKYQLLLPKLEEQRVLVKSIAAIAEATQRLESLYQQKLAALDALRKSLLHQAFSGQL
jgi:type I restriction enzyme S subunit